MKRRLAFVAAALLAGCSEGEPTVIDGSSPQAFEQSVKDARRDLPDADRLVFDRAVKTVGGRWMGAADKERLARTTFDGMTAQQVVEDQKGREIRGQQ